MKSTSHHLFKNVTDIAGFVSLYCTPLCILLPLFEEKMFRLICARAWHCLLLLPWSDVCKGNAMLSSRLQGTSCWMARSYTEGPIVKISTVDRRAGTTCANASNITCLDSSVCHLPMSMNNDDNVPVEVRIHPVITAAKYSD